MSIKTTFPRNYNKNKWKKLKELSIFEQDAIHMWAPLTRVKTPKTT